MIHYHGTPITPDETCLSAVKGGHAFVSHRYPGQLGLILDVCQSFAVDNGAFSAWKSGSPVEVWSRYYEWVARLHRFPSFDFAVIPDVIDGDEKANDELIAEWPWKDSFKSKGVGAPVWHMHESIDRLFRLATEWPRVCIGSSAQYAVVGSGIWWNRMAEAMNAICDKEGNPICKLHGLRMLDVDVFSRFPFSSADSTNIAQNVGIDQKWKGTYTPASKNLRALVMRDRIESVQALTFWDKKQIQRGLDI
ncbi:hypothetical protein [Nitrosomonas sp.]|uniref:hypothetical protein n=1 Tax=Nitrosomonas sp. TaxID=42353 RepID=UPI0025D3D19C|nr:hypothetical protein [Nitrosomonas sp.]